MDDDVRTLDSLRWLVLSANEIRALTDWPDALIEDYLNIIDNIIIISGLLDVEINQKLEEVPTYFSNGSIPFVNEEFLAEDNERLLWNVAQSMLEVGGRIKSHGRVKNTTRVGNTPYTVQDSDEIIFVDTDEGPITVNLINSTGQSIQIINTGTSGNNVTIEPDGLLNGVAESEYLVDGENLILTYDDTEGWF